MTMVKWSLVVAVGVFAFLSAGCEQTQVTNPDYTCWKKFPPGSSVTFEGLQRVGDNNPETTTLTIDLIDLNDQHAVLRRTVAFPSRADTSGKSQTSSEPRKIKKADHPETHPKTQKQFKGWGTIMIEDKKYPCTIWEYKTTHKVEKLGMDEDGTLVVKEWKSKDIPGGIARIEYEVSTPHQHYQIAGEVVTFHIEAEQPKIENPNIKKTSSAKKAVKQPVKKESPKKTPAATKPEPKSDGENKLPELEDIKLKMQTSETMPKLAAPAGEKTGGKSK